MWIFPVSTDGGLTFPHLLLTGTPNDGTEEVTRRKAPSRGCIMESGTGNFFQCQLRDFYRDCVPDLTITDNPAGTCKALRPDDHGHSERTDRRLLRRVGDSPEPGFQAVPAPIFWWDTSHRPLRPFHRWDR